MNAGAGPRAYADTEGRDARRFRVWILIVIVGLVLSGLTAFPLLAEVELLGRVLGLPPGDVPSEAARGFETGVFSGLRGWIYTVRQGLRDTYSDYPWVAYGTDWLAFGHLVIAGFFVGPLVWPRRDHRWTLIMGMIACVGVVPLAVIAGEVRGIPWGWRLIDCAFGVFGIVPLVLAYRLHQRVGPLFSDQTPRSTADAGR